jgi:hypothetical protein
MSTRTLLAALAAIATIAAAPVAQADVVYTYAGAFTVTEFPDAIPFSMALDLADEAVASGGFLLVGSCPYGYGGCVHYGPPIFSGNVNGFRSITIERETIDALHLFDFIQLGITFDGLGDITYFDLNYLDYQTSVQNTYVTAPNVMSTVFAADWAMMCEGQFPCTASGTWTHTPIPEPSGVLPLGAGALVLLALGLARTRDSRST